MESGSLNGEFEVLIRLMHEYTQVLFFFLLFFLFSFLSWEPCMVKISCLFLLGVQLYKQGVGFVIAVFNILRK